MTDYNALAEALKVKVEPQAMDLLRRVREVCQRAGLDAPNEPFDMSADDYRWSLVVKRPGSASDNDLIDITVEIAEQRQYEGVDEDTFGVTFGLDIVEYGGRILGGFAPFNYTPQCWVDMRDGAAVDERWALFAGVKLESIPGLITTGGEQ